MILLFSHVRTGRWASVMPAKLAATLGLTGTIRRQLLGDSTTETAPPAPATEAAAEAAK